MQVKYIYKAINIIIAISVIVSLSWCKNSASNDYTNQNYSTPSVEDTYSDSALSTGLEYSKDNSPNSSNSKDYTKNITLIYPNKTAKKSKFYVDEWIL